MADSYTFAIVMDAAPRGRRGVQFNACWIARMLDGLSAEFPSTASLLATFQASQRRLRQEGFFQERASYVALLLPREPANVVAFHCGDCVLGSQSANGTVEWLTRSHTLADAFDELGASGEPHQRHLVTRTLNARRHHRPEVSSLADRDANAWVLATDGYRHEESDAAGRPVDDCSHLLIGAGVEPTPSSDPGNLFVRIAN